MHPEALEWVARHAVEGTVLDVGGRDINGTPRHLYGPDYTTVDLYEPADHVGDIRTMSLGKFDTVLCLEVFEHTSLWVEVLNACWAHTRHRLIVTAAGPDRASHSALDGGGVREGEWYRNIHPDELTEALARLGGTFSVDCTGPDVRGVADRRST